MKEVLYLREYITEKNHVIELRNHADITVKEIKVILPAYKTGIKAVVDLTTWAENEGFLVDDNSDFVMKYPDFIGDYKKVMGKKRFFHSVEGQFGTLCGNENFFYYWKNELDYFEVCRDRNGFIILEKKHRRISREYATCESEALSTIKRFIGAKKRSKEGKYYGAKAQYA